MPHRNDEYCQRLSNKVNAVVININYRLAPEFPYPTALFDVYDTVLYVKNNPPKGADVSKFAIGGHSAGGTLAAALCLLTREKNTVSF